MRNSYQTIPAVITKISPQTDNIKLFRFEFEKKSFKISGDDFIFRPGQFLILSLPGWGEAPFAPCNRLGEELELCVRSVGRLTRKLHSLKIGDKVGLRGPYGNGWPLNDLSQIANSKSSEKKNLLIIVGGLGLIPLRTLILGKKEFLGKDAKIQIFYGAKHPSEMLFSSEYKDWRKNGVDLQLTIDASCPEWRGCVGLVTKLFDAAKVVENARAFVCGPPVMYKSVIEKLKEKKFEEEDIYLSFERRMHCGIGVCQHCGVGNFYTCKHGPVFEYGLIKNTLGAI
ncbi:MAG: FAD/NAD(P)-binding protein [Candidatus Portnoybacteria bacterium]|nr:FAD/NAD(P)-binding protein [Candidatus Portnoybacteria bacterium]